MRRLLERLRSRLTSPHATAWIVALSIVLAVPTLWSGLAVDDYWHRIMLTRDPSWPTVIMKPWYDLFVFFDGEPIRTQHLLEAGLEPWWADPSLVFAFFRPVTAATHVLDYALWPAQVWLMHAQSIAWYAVLVAVTAWMYRRVIARGADGQSGAAQTWIASLAALLFAMDFNHGVPVGWIASRNALVAAVFGVTAVAAHDVAMQASLEAHARKSAAWTVASAASLGLALCAGESAAGALGYVVAHALFLDGRAWRRRASSLALHGLVVMAWASFYRAAGYGVRGSGMYVEALRDPVHFAGHLLVHLPLQISSELGATPPDLYSFVPLPGQIAFVTVAVLFVAWSAPAVVRLLRVDPSARFFVVGGVLATLPTCMTFPTGRTMTLPSVGLVGLAALIGAGVFDSAAWVPAAGARWRTWIRSYALWACGARLVLSPIALQVNLQQIAMLNGIMSRMTADLPVSAEAESKRLLLTNAPDTVFAPYLVVGPRSRGERLPSRILTMAGGARDVEVTRVDEQTVHVRAVGGFYREGTELVTRSAKSPMAVGTKVLLSDVTIEVRETTPDGNPVEAAFRFAGSADAEAFVWARWEGPRLVVIHPPPVGERLTIRGQLPQIQ